MANAEMQAEEKLAAEMAAISVVKSQEIVANAADAADLNRFQNRLDDDKDRVLMVHNTLQNLKAYEVTPTLAETLDKALERSEVQIQAAPGATSVEGFEALGRTLMPKDYLASRLVGCEGFLEDFFKKSGEITTRIGTAFRESWIGLTQTQDSLAKAVGVLDNSINTSPDYPSQEMINIGERLFNLFKVNNQVKGDWVGSLDKLNKSVAGLSNNYYLNNKNTLNSTISYFGGFAGMTEAEAQESLLRLPSAIPSERFKECTYPNQQFAGPGITAKQSVELMGGAYFVDTRQASPNLKPKDISEMEAYLDRYLNVDVTGFENSAPMIFPELGLEVKSLSKAEIKAVVKLLKDILKEWAKVCEAGERFKLGDSDYKDVVKGFLEADLSDATKDRLLTAFSAIVRKNQMELLNIRIAINNYLVLIVNGMVELCYTSIKVNTP